MNKNVYFLQMLLLRVEKICATTTITLILLMYFLTVGQISLNLNLSHL